MEHAHLAIGLSSTPGLKSLELEEFLDAKAFGVDSTLKKP
jgi:hypothetical protein